MISNILLKRIYDYSSPKLILGQNPKTPTAELKYESKTLGKHLSGTNRLTPYCDTRTQISQTFHPLQKCKYVKESSNCLSGRWHS